MALMDYASVAQLTFYGSHSSSMLHASVHRHCVLESLKTNNQCVYCRQVQDPQDIIDCTPISIAFSGDASKTKRSQVNAAQESIMSGEALKVPPEAKMSQ